jgi:hypothetical protein
MGGVVEAQAGAGELLAHGLADDGFDLCELGWREGVFGQFARSFGCAKSSPALRLEHESSRFLGLACRLERMPCGSPSSGQSTKFTGSVLSVSLPRAGEMKRYKAKTGRVDRCDGGYKGRFPNL